MGCENCTTGEPAASESKKPMVYLVGAGPGDPGLITVRGRELLGRAEVVIYDYLASRRLLQYVPASAELIYAGKKGGSKHTHTQEEINQMLVDRAKSGKTVVRLKGGDPFIFGRGGEEVEELFKSGLAFEVVPGVTSATAAATYAGIPITHRRFTATVAFVTGHEDPTKPGSNVAWDKLATGVGTLVIYMGIKNLPSITEKLIRYGRGPETPVAVVRWASTPEQRTVVGTLATIADVVREADIRPPALVVVGEVVSLRDTINWFEKRPLFRKKVLVTRTREQASELVHRLEELGAECREYATIAILPMESYAELDRELARIDRFDWLVFTSINAVKYFFARLFELGQDARALSGVKIAVVGRTTGEVLAGYGLRADLVPLEFTGDGLAEALVREGMDGKKILIPRALKARESLPETVRSAGAEVAVVPVYRNVVPVDSDEENTGPAALRRELEEGDIDVVTFTSSSTVTNFVQMLAPADQDDLRRIMAGVTVVAIGPLTARTVEKNGLTVDVQPADYTIPKMVDSIVAHFLAEGGGEPGIPGF